MLMQYPDPSLPWPIVMPAVALIAEKEQGPHGGVALEAYRCPAGVWTYGWGETEGVRPGDTCTKEQADQWLLEDLTERTREVLAMCTVQPSPNELGALVSLAYNIGLGWKGTIKPSGAKDGLRQSTVLRQHNAGNKQAAARAFGLWNKGTDPDTGQKVELRGLTIRRAQESALYLTPEPGEAPARMPQAVEGESNPITGPIGKAAAVIVGAPVVQLATDASEGIAALKPAVVALRDFAAGTLGIPPGYVLPILVLVAGVLVFRTRITQRSEGWA